MSEDTSPQPVKRGRFYFFERGGDMPGITVSKRDTLPAGDFRVTEYVFRDCGYLTLWFVDADGFTRTERQSAYQKYIG